VKIQGCSFSVSGIENQVGGLIAKGERPANVARFVENTLQSAISRAAEAALKEYPGLEILCSGGVAANRSIRKAMEARFGAVFAKPEYAGDNALGTAVLAMRALQR
jgi:N6-L-threonylcarbamoyladenine synthase